MYKKRGFIIIGMFWAIGIAGFVLSKEYTLRTGTEILLKTQPVDPRDLFRGDYVILSYDISWFDAGAKQASLVRNFHVDDTIFVSLNTDEEYATIRQVHYDPPAEDLYLKGRVTGVRGERVTVAYGIESYFVPEGEGKRIERQRNRGKVDVVAAVDRRGKVMIKKLLLDKEEVRFE